MDEYNTFWVKKILIINDSKTFFKYVYDLAREVEITI